MTKPAKKEESTEVAVVQANSLAVLGVSAEELSAEIGAGLEGLSSTDMQIPFLKLLQSNSPQVDKKKPASLVPGAEEGFFINTVTDRLWDGNTGVQIIIASMRHRYVAWKLREKGGGLVADYGSDASILKQTTRDEKYRNILNSDKDVHVVESYEYFILALDEKTGEADRIILSLSSTQLKKGKNLNTILASQTMPDPKGSGRRVTAPIYYTIYRLTSVPESNDSGSWMGVKIKPEMAITDHPQAAELFGMARQFKEMVSSGVVKAAAPVDPVEADDVASREVPF